MPVRGEGDLGTVVGVGIDLVEVARVRRALERRPGLARRLFTATERDYAEAARHPDRRAQRYATRFAAKEAAMKALGVGLGRIDWHDVQVGRAPSGAPSLQVAGRAARIAAERGGDRWAVSLTHTGVSAGAVVLLGAAPER